MPLTFFRNQKQKRREKKIQKGICPACSGRGIFTSSIESVYIADCDTCLGIGKATRDS